MTQLCELTLLDDNGDLVVSVIVGTTSVRLTGFAGRTLGVEDSVDIVDDVTPPVRGATVPTCSQPMPPSRRQ